MLTKRKLIRPSHRPTYPSRVHKDELVISNPGSKKESGVIALVTVFALSIRPTQGESRFRMESPI